MIRVFECVLLHYLEPPLKQYGDVSIVMWVWVEGFSKVMATFNHVDGSFNLSMATTGDVRMIHSLGFLGYVLHIEHISCVITNCGQHQ